MSLRRLLEGQQLPLTPDVESKASMEKWIRDLNDYLRRLAGIFSAVNILNTIVEEGTGDITINNLVDFVDFQASPTVFDGDDLIVYSELTTNTSKYKLYVDISAIDGYSASEYQFLIHNDAAAIHWAGMDEFTGYDAAQVEFLSHNSSGDPTWVDLTSSDITGYNASNTQVLTHVTGTLTWVDTDTC